MFSVLNALSVIIFSLLLDFGFAAQDSLPYDEINPNMEQDTEHSLYERFQPYMKVAAGCRSFPAFNFEGKHASVPGNGEDSQCRVCIPGSNTYARLWQEPLYLDFAIMYTHFYPKMHRDLDPFIITDRNHPYYWDGYVVFLKAMDYLKPFGCALWSRDNWIVHPKERCHFEGDIHWTVIETINDQAEFDHEDRRMYKREKLVIHELMTQAQILAFDSVDWQHGRCQMQERYFNKLMLNLMQMARKL